MSFVQRLLHNGRVRTAKRELTRDPSAKGYVSLAREYVRLGELRSALKVCQEGLEQYPGHQELIRLLVRSSELLREDRLRELQRDLREAPRPAIFRELCEVLLEAGRVDRAEECAQQWRQFNGEPLALYAAARARAERFFADRRREDGLMAFKMLDELDAALPRDLDAVQLRLQLASRAGAWKEARKAAALLLELTPGEPGLEARFRSLMGLSDNAPTIDQALREVERTGRLSDDDDPVTDSGEPESGAIRPLMQELAAVAGVEAVIYARGGTALVQGPKGATAERTARAVREVAQKSRTQTRRLGLGHTLDVRLEGDFGTLLLAPSQLGAGAIWTRLAPTPHQEEAIQELIGADSGSEERRP